MVNPKPGSDAYAVLACIVRNPGIQPSDVATILWPLPDMPAMPHVATLAELRQVVAERDLVRAERERELAERAARASEIIGRLTSAGYVAPVTKIRLAGRILEKFGSIEAAVLRLLGGRVVSEEKPEDEDLEDEEEVDTEEEEPEEEPEDTEENPAKNLTERPKLPEVLPYRRPDWGPPFAPVVLRPPIPADPPPPQPCKRAVELLRRVQESPCSASELVGARPCGYDSELLTRLFEAGLLEGGRLRVATEKGVDLVAKNNARPG